LQDNYKKNTDKIIGNKC